MIKISEGRIVLIPAILCETIDQVGEYQMAFSFAIPKPGG